MFFKQKAYGRFLIHSTNQYGVHSPFVYQFLIKCLYRRKKHPAYAEIKKYKKNLSASLSAKAYTIRFKRLKQLNRMMRYFEVEQAWDLSDSNGLISFAMAEQNELQVRPIVLSNDFDTSDAFQKLLQELKNHKQSKSCIYIGNSHKDFPFYEAFKALLPDLNSKSFVILEGVHRSPTAEIDWEKIKAHEKVSVSIDLFYISLVFFKKGQAKQHFKIRS